MKPPSWTAAGSGKFGEGALGAEGLEVVSGLIRQPTRRDLLKELHKGFHHFPTPF